MSKQGPDPIQAASNDELATSVQRDWDDREFTDVFQLNIAKVARFLSEFDATMKAKLGSLNERLLKLERTVDFCEAVCASSLAAHADK